MIRRSPPSLKTLAERTTFVLLVFVADIVSSASAAFVAPTNWTRGQARSTYQEWDVFDSPDGSIANVPDIGFFNPNAPAGAGYNVYDTSLFSFLTGGGNIYSNASILDLYATVPSAGLGSWFHTTVIVQTRTLNSEIDYPNQTVNGVHSTSGYEISRVPFTIGFGDGAFIVERYTKFELNGNDLNYEFHFPTTGFSSSFDELLIDTYTTLSGDANGDDKVDIGDIAAIANNWQITGAAGDVNFDGKVDIGDIALVANNWQHSAANAPPAQPLNLTMAVPEPATYGLLISGGLMLAASVARRNRARVCS